MAPCVTRDERRRRYRRSRWSGAYTAAREFTFALVIDEAELQRWRAQRGGEYTLSVPPPANDAPLVARFHLPRDPTAIAAVLRPFATSM